MIVFGVILKSLKAYEMRIFTLDIFLSGEYNIRDQRTEVQRMSNREIASSILDNLTDEQITAFITLFADENVQAMIEADRIANDPNRKHFGSFSEIEKEIFKDEIPA